MRNNKGMVLMFVLGMSVILILLGAAFLMIVASQSKRVTNEGFGTHAFYMAEAGLDDALFQLRQGITSYVNWPGSLTNDLGGNIGTYDSNWQPVTASTWLINSKGMAGGRKRNLSVIVEASELVFFDNAIYVDGDITISGGSYSIDGDVSYSGTLDGSDSGITGTSTQDTSMPSPSEMFDSVQLYATSAAQGNVYDQARIDSGEPFPTSFWYDEGNQIPNIIYVEVDATFDSSVSIPSGFFVVAGNATISGGTEVDGSIYSMGTVTINGGGGDIINVNGGIWADNIDLNGSVSLVYNQVYMESIQQSLSISTARFNVMPGTWTRS